jgi:hypothetical protein
MILFIIMKGVVRISDEIVAVEMGEARVHAKEESGEQTESEI